MNQTVATTIIPCPRYRDASPPPIWLIGALGFEKCPVHLAPHNTVMHAELTFGSGMIKLGSVPGQGGSSPYSALCL